MSKKIKRLLLVIVILAVIVLVISYLLSSNKGGSNFLDTSGNLVGQSYDSTNSSAPQKGGSVMENSYDSQDSTKVIKKSTITMQTDNYDKSLSNINALIAQTESMVVKMQETLGNNYYNKQLLDGKARTVDIIVKVPQSDFTYFNNMIKTYADVLSYYEDAQDVSSQYIDIEAKISSYKLQEQQLNDLLKRATVARDLLEISNQIQSVIEKRESLQRQKDSLDNQIAYSTVSIKLTEVASTEITEKSYLSKIKDTFVSSIMTLRDAVANVFIFVVYMLPYIVIVLLLLLIMYLFSKRKRK